jgi:hypothetical protein
MLSPEHNLKAYREEEHGYSHLLKSSGIHHAALAPEEEPVAAGEE